MLGGLILVALGAGLMGLKILRRNTLQAAKRCSELLQCSNSAFF
jgi:hypothetical protein